MTYPPLLPGLSPQPSQVVPDTRGGRGGGRRLHLLLLRIGHYQTRRDQALHQERHRGQTGQGLEISGAETGAGRAAPFQGGQGSAQGWQGGALGGGQFRPELVGAGDEAAGDPAQAPQIGQGQQGVPGRPCVPASDRLPVEVIKNLLQGRGPMGQQTGLRLQGVHQPASSATGRFLVVDGGDPGRDLDHLADAGRGGGLQGKPAHLVQFRREFGQAGEQGEKVAAQGGDNPDAVPGGQAAQGGEEGPRRRGQGYP